MGRITFQKFLLMKVKTVFQELFESFFEIGIGMQNGLLEFMLEFAPEARNLVQKLILRLPPER